MIRQPIRTETSQPLILAGRNKTYRMEPDPGMKEQWARFMEDFGKIEGQVGFCAYGVCHSFDQRAGTMDYMCAVEVADEGQVPNYLFTLMIPKRRIAVFQHEGPVEEIPKTWNRIFAEWLPAAKLEVADGPQFETYGDDSHDDDSGESKIAITIPVK